MQTLLFVSESTVKIQKFGTNRENVVIILKFEQCGFTILKGQTV